MTPEDIKTLRSLAPPLVQARVDHLPDFPEAVLCWDNFSIYLRDHGPEKTLRYTAKVWFSGKPIGEASRCALKQAVRDARYLAHTHLQDLSRNIKP